MDHLLIPEEYFCFSGFLVLEKRESKILSLANLAQQREIEEILTKWKNEKGRKPLILSGARQVGKSYVIEQNFARHFERLLSINFEKHASILRQSPRHI